MSGRRGSQKKHTFKRRDYVVINVNGQKSGHRTISSLGGTQLRIVDIKPVPASEQAGVEHHQMVKIEGEYTARTDWVPADWFDPGELHIFKKNEEVRVVPSVKRGDPLWNLRNDQLVIETYMSVAPGNRHIVGHHQQVKVRVKGERWVSEWISGAWFVPANHK